MVKQVLIIKTGHSETYCYEVDQQPSLGDVLRTTVLSSALPNTKIVWLVSKEASELVSRDRHHVFYYPEDVEQIKRMNFDLIINLEKGEPFLKLASELNGEKKVGFVNSSSIMDGLFQKIYLSRCRDHNWSLGLLEILGIGFNNHEYHFNRHILSVKRQVGFNWIAGPKWKNKDWPKKNWDRLEVLLKQSGYGVSWQRGLNSVVEYADWISSNELVVSIDSLGLHLAIATKRKVVALFGPTPSREIFLYSRGIALEAPDCKCIKLGKRDCDFNYCMEKILPEEVFERVTELVAR